MKTIMLFLAVLLLVPSVVSATDYYVRTDGNDNLDGLSDATAWQTISEVSSRSFQPGDTIHFKAGEVWREEMIVSWSGTEGTPITITRYGSGPNPKISSGEAVTAGQWVQETAHIYSFSTGDADPNWLNSRGAIDANGKLMSRYYSADKSSTSKYNPPSSVSSPDVNELEANMLDGFSWSPSNQGKIFIRSDSGNPGTVIVGKRRNCIYIHGHSHITIDSIDFEGPGGPITQGNTNQYYRGLIMAHGGWGETTTHITVRNCILKNNEWTAIQFREGASYSVAENNVVEDCWGGVHGYGRTNYVTVRNNVMRNIGTQIVSGGDRAAISTWGHHWTVEDNYIENHGWRGQRAQFSPPENCFMDSAIVMCCGDELNPPTLTSHHVIRNNYIKNIMAGGIIVRSGGFNEIYNNIIDGWNLDPNSYGDTRNMGILSRGLMSDSLPSENDTKIYNNVIYGGVYHPDDPDTESAIFISREHIRSEVKNNIVFGNEAGIVAYRYWIPNDCNRGSPCEGNVIDNNIFHVPSGNAARWGDTFYDIDHMLNPGSCFPPWDNWECSMNAQAVMASVKNNMIDDPLFVSPETGDFHLQPNSPAIDAGADVPTTRDFEGKPVPIDGDDDGTAEFDIGAIEYQPGGCTEDWTCTDWVCSACVDSQQDCTRTCTDENECGTEDDKPHEAETRTCGTGELVGHWTFDTGDISGDQVQDISGFGNDGAIHGAVQVTGRVREALYFDGLDDYIDCGSDTSLDTNEMTVLVWINPSSAGEGGTNAAVATKAEDDPIDWSWQIRYNAPGGGDYMGFQATNITGERTWTSVEQNLVPGTWYHIAATFDGSHMSMYLDGQETGSETLSDIKSSASSFLIGNDGWDNIFNGTIDDVMIWNRALTSQEILDIYDSSFHKADISPKDGCVEEEELIPFIDLWKYDSTANPMVDVMEAVTLWSRGTGCS